jgi:hypothetical protein
MLMSAEKGGREDGRRRRRRGERKEMNSDVL